MFYWLCFLCSLWPAQTFARPLYHPLFLWCSDQVFRDLAGLAFIGHPFWYWPALLFYHGKVFVVLVSVEEQFASVELNQNAGHWPDVRGFIPSQSFKDNLRGPVLSSVNYQCVIFIMVRWAAEVNYFYIALFWLQPLIFCFLPWEFTFTGAPVTAENFFFCLDVLKEIKMGQLTFGN